MSHQLYITAEQKIVLSDLLFYMQNKLQSTAHDDIVKTCAEFYDDAYIWEEKEKFFLAIGKKPIKSRTADKKIKDLNDILAEMSTRDIGGDFQPTCVSIELCNLPPAEDGAVQNSQILESLRRMRKDLVSRSTLEMALTSLRSDIMNMVKDVRRGGRPPSPYPSPRRAALPFPPSGHSRADLNRSLFGLSLGNDGNCNNSIGSSKNSNSANNDCLAAASIMPAATPSASNTTHSTQWVKEGAADVAAAVVDIPDAGSLPVPGGAESVVDGDDAAEAGSVVDPQRVNNSVGVGGSTERNSINSSGGGGGGSSSVGGSSGGEERDGRNDEQLGRWADVGRRRGPTTASSRADKRVGGGVDAQRRINNNDNGSQFQGGRARGEVVIRLS